MKEQHVCSSSKVKQYESTKQVCKLLSYFARHLTVSQCRQTIHMADRQSVTALIIVKSVGSYEEIMCATSILLNTQMPIAYSGCYYASAPIGWRH